MKDKNKELDRLELEFVKFLTKYKVLNDKLIESGDYEGASDIDKSTLRYYEHEMKEISGKIKRLQRK